VSSRGGGPLSTTAVFAEILIVGLQAEAWLALALLTVFGHEWLFELDGVNDFAALLTIVVLALAYVLGIIVDRLADTLLDSFEHSRLGKRVKTKFMSKPEEPEPEPRLSTMRMTVMAASDDMTSFLDYQRSRWRIARATVLNLVVAAPVVALYLVYGTNLDGLWALVPVASALVLIPITYFAGVRIQDAWVARLKDAYDILQATPQQ
jgi:hypothetical protein